MLYRVRQMYRPALVLPEELMLRYPSRAPTSSLCPSTPVDMFMRTQKPPTP